MGHIITVLNSGITRTEQFYEDVLHPPIYRTLNMRFRRINKRTIILECRCYCSYDFIPGLSDILQCKILYLQDWIVDMLERTDLIDDRK